MNEVLFREMNEQVQRRASAVRGDTEPFVIMCECGNIECTERLGLQPEEFESVRQDPARFIVVPGHAIVDIEEVVGSNERFEIVLKVGVAGQVAASHDGSDAPEPETD